MELKLTVEDSVMCSPDTAIISFNFGKKMDTIEELETSFDECIETLKEIIRSNLALDESKLEIGSLYFRQVNKNVTVEKTNSETNEVEKTKEERFDGYTLNCAIKYVDKITNKGVYDFYTTLMENVPFSISMNFECRNLENYKDDLLKKLIKKGKDKANLIAQEYDCDEVVLKKMDFSATKNNVFFNEYKRNSLERGISNFLDEVNKRDIELKDSLTLEYEMIPKLVH